MEEMKATKKCSTCGRELPLEMFSKKTNSKDGLQYDCKECQAKKNRELYLRKNSIPSVQKVYKDEKTLVKVYSNPELAKFQPRELMRELASRGYIGKLEYIVRHEIDITKII